MRGIRGVVTGLVVGGLVASTGASGAGASRPSSSPAPSYYLALGDSVPVWTGNLSYPNLIAEHYASSIPGLTLENLAISGESTGSMRTGGQYSRALAFLGAHRGHVVLITIDIGGNDIVYCGTTTSLDSSCVNRALTTIAQNLSVMLAGLHAAAPSVRIIGMNYYDPYLGNWLARGATRMAALATLHVLETLNAELVSLYGGPAHAANVQHGFRSFDHKQVNSPWGRVPNNVALACSWLDILCRPGSPEGFGDDPNVAGEAQIALAFEHTIGALYPS